MGFFNVSDAMALGLIEGADMAFENIRVQEKEDYDNAKRKVNKVRLDDQENFTQIPDISEMDEQVGYNEFVTLVDDHINNWRWYDKTLFRLYRDTDMSIRKIADETKISWVSIYNTLKKCKEELRELFDEDYLDLKYKEYERITTKGQED